MAKQIFSVTQLRKELRVGDNVEVIYHLINAGVDPNTGETLYKSQVRPVRQVCSKNNSSFCLATLNEDNEWEARRLKIPKASQCSFTPDGAMTILGKDIDNPKSKSKIKWLTLRIV